MINYIDLLFSFSLNFKNMVILRQKSFAAIRELVDEVKDLGDIKLVKGEFGMIARLLRKIPYFRERQNRLLIYDVILKQTGKNIGMIEVNEDIPGTELNIVWLEIKTKNRGLGYATKVMEAIIQEAKRLGYKRITLEVPGNSPDAKHIYQKLGFKETGEVLGDENDIWEGLTCMELIL
jgi:ribosomal protein S18 acetylase RimI-like enzyme